MKLVDAKKTMEISMRKQQWHTPIRQLATKRHVNAHKVYFRLEEPDISLTNHVKFWVKSAIDEVMERPDVVEAIIDHQDPMLLRAQLVSELSEHLDKAIGGLTTQALYDKTAGGASEEAVIAAFLENASMYQSSQSRLYLDRIVAMYQSPQFAKYHKLHEQMGAWLEGTDLSLTGKKESEQLKC